MCQRSETIKEITGALVKFQHEVGKIARDASNPFFKSKYASLANIQDAIREPLFNCGLAYTQHPNGENELTTILMHVSGEFLQSTYRMVPVKSDPQSVGSAITYQRRYALAAILGLNIDDDDDGNAASGKTNQPAKTTPPAPSKEPQPKRRITLKELADPITSDTIYSWMYKGESKGGRDFNYIDFVSKTYDIAPDAVATLSTCYEDYRRTKNTNKS